jgi:hypothetical protein
MVTLFLGGIYADSDTVCQKPIMEWGQMFDDSLILGVEAQNVDTGDHPLHEGARNVLVAQYVFGHAAMHPMALLNMRRILTYEKRLLEVADQNLPAVDRLKGVLATTGER